MIGVLGFLLFIIGVVSLSVFLILWIVKSILKTPYSRKNYAIYTSVSFVIIIFSIILRTTAEPVSLASIDRFTERGSEITGLKTTTQIAKQNEINLKTNKDEDAAQVKTEIEGKDESKTPVEQSKKEETIEVKAKRIAYEIFEFGGDSIDATVKEVIFDEDDNSLSIKVLGKDGWTEKSIGLGFYEDSTNLYRELSQEEQLNEVWITILFPMKDTYGNVKEEEVMGTWMSRETMNKINWNSFDYKDLLDVVDGKRIYPQFVQ